MNAKSKFIEAYKALSPDQKIMFKHVMTTIFGKDLKKWLKTAWRYSDEEDSRNSECMSSNELKNNTLNKVFDLYDLFVLNKKFKKNNFY